MYKFLVSNDDGINSEGLAALVKELDKYGTVYAVAPAEEQSGKSMALTYAVPITVEEAELEGAERAYVVSGTPVDCVKWALDYYRGKMDFDFVISGINLGVNSGPIHFYSGTVAAAREGSIQGVRSIALSLEGYHSKQFEYICSMIPDLLEMSLKIDPHTLLNVNAPDIHYSEVKGVRICKGAEPDYGECYHFAPNDDGTFQIAVTYNPIDPSLDDDVTALSLGYATITPISANICDMDVLAFLNSEYDN